MSRIKVNSFLIVMVGGAFGNFGGAVDLLGDNEASKCVREDEFGKTPKEVGVTARFFGEAVGAADQNDNIFSLPEDAS